MLLKCFHSQTKIDTIDFISESMTRSGLRYVDLMRKPCLLGINVKRSLYLSSLYLPTCRLWCPVHLEITIITSVCHMRRV